MRRDSLFNKILLRRVNENKKRILLIILFFIASLLVSCGSDVKVVRKLPAEFIKLSSEDGQDQYGLHYIFEKTQILFFDADEICIYQTELQNTEFIVKYENEYYVLEEKYSQLVAMAKGVTVQRNTQYTNGDTIGLRGIGLVPYTVEFYEVRSYRDGLYQIIFIMGSNIPEDKQSEIFNYVETDNGTIIKDYEYNGGTFEVETPINEKIKTITIKSPDYPGCIRTITDGSSIKVVQTNPEGYIQLDKAVDNHGNTIDFLFFENGISFIDSDGVGIYGAAVYDQSFLVEYEDELYVNEKKYLEIAEIANVVDEQRNKVYHLTEEVKLRGGDNDYKDGYSIKISEVKKGTDTGTYIIKFVITPAVSDYKTMKIFDHIETDQGIIIKEFTFIGTGEVQVTVPDGEKINFIVVKSPDYSEAIRKISAS